MKKAINKSERYHIITSLVVEASLSAAQEAIDTLAVLRKQIAEVLIGNWEDNFPGITSQDRLALLQSGGANRLTFKSSIYGKNGKEASPRNNGEFGKLYWANPGTESDKTRVGNFASRIFHLCTGAPGVVVESVTNGYSSQIYLYSTYNDIINGCQPSALYDASLATPKEVDPVLNDALLSLHVKVMQQLKLLKDLIYSCEDAYQALSAALAPIKTAQELAELMPEAVKFFPPSLTYVKPTKEIADPKAINEIRAKLKKGLPI